MPISSLPETNVNQQDVAIRPQPLEYLVFAGILLLYAVLGTLFALRTPDWQAPDEPAHYNYIAQIAAGTPLPIIREGDWDQAYLSTLTSSGFAPEHLANLETVRYENHQPPLYYWLQTPLFLLTDGSLLALRMFSVGLGGVLVWLAYRITREVFPHQRVLALAVMGMVAFVPQQLHMTSSVNNDALAGLVIAALLLLSIRYLKGRHQGQEWLFGLLLGVAVITKTTSYFMAGVVFVVLLLRWYITREQAQPALARLRAWLMVGIPAGVVALAYWGRNIAVYGFPDFLGLREHDRIVIGQPRTADKIADVGFTAYLQEAITTTFHSFWGQFGWMAAPMDGAIPGIYTLILALVLLAASGCLVRVAWGDQEKDPHPTTRRAIFATLGLVMIFSLLQFVYYNTTFVQFQGRYIFAGMIPFALFFVLGVDTWRSLLLRRWPSSRWLTVVPVLAFAMLDGYLIWRVIPGALS